MAMEADEDDVWRSVATSPSVSPPATSLSFNTRLHLLGPFLPGVSVGSPSSPFFSAAASPFPRLPALDAGPARRALEREMCLGPSSAGAAGGSVAPVERRKKRMIKNRESASRSRARKHTHVTLIESEVIELREANQQLRIKYDKLKAAVEVSVPVRKTLQRVLSAPF